MTKQEIHQRLVFPVCALEEYCHMGSDSSPIVDVITMTLRRLLNDIEMDVYNNKEDK